MERLGGKLDGCRIVLGQVLGTGTRTKALGRWQAVAFLIHLPTELLNSAHPKLSAASAPTSLLQKVVPPASQLLGPETLELSWTPLCPL